MRLQNAVLLWNETDLRIVKRGDFKTIKENGHLRNSEWGVNVGWDELTEEECQNRLLTSFVQLTVYYKIDPEKVNNEFLKIKQFTVC